MTKIPEDFKEIHTLDGLKEYLKKTKAKNIGFFGGRKFVHGDSKGELTLNHIVRKFGFVVAKFWPEVDHLTEFEEQMLEIQNRIAVLDNEASKKVKKKNWLIRIMTRIRHEDRVIIANFLTSFPVYVYRKDVLKSISDFKTNLTKIREAKAADVGKLFDDSFKEVSPTVQSARDALVNYVKLDNEKNSEHLKNAVKELLKKELLKNDQYSMTLEELIHKFLTNVDKKLFLPLAQFIFQLYASAKQLNVNDDKFPFKCMSLRNAPELSTLQTKDTSRPKLYIYLNIYKQSDEPALLKYHLDGSINVKPSERKGW